MKQVIVLVGAMLLGIYIFDLMTVGDDSLLAASERAFLKTKEAYGCMN